EAVVAFGNKQGRRAAGAVAAKVNAVGVDKRLSGEELGGSNDIVNFAEEAFFSARVHVAAAQRGKHHDDSSLAICGCRLVVIGRRWRPDIADGIAIASGNPDDRGVLLAVVGVGGEVSRKLADR